MSLEQTGSPKDDALSQIYSPRRKSGRASCDPFGTRVPEIHLPILWPAREPKYTSG